MPRKSETDLKSVKAITKSIARIVTPTPAGEGVFSTIAIHPFIESMFWFERAYKDGNDLTDYLFTKDGLYDEWIEEFSKMVDNRKDLTSVYILWRTPWKLTFMKMCGEYLSEKDYAEYLADAWVVEENPNMDVNVSREEAIEMFKSVKKHYLMDKEDLEYWKKLPEEVELWRGVSKRRVDLGLSWTDDREKAEWFMNRFKESSEGEMKLLKVVAPKKHCIAYFNTRGEKEVLLDVFAIEDKIERVM